MSTSLRILAVSALLASGIPALTSAASAAPLGEPLAIAKAVPAVTQTVQWRGRGWGWGGAAVGGLVAGAIVGCAIAAGAPYGPGYYGPPPAAYYGPPPGDAVSYCMQQYRSYDPRSGTYLGYDGYRHPCP